MTKRNEVVRKLMQAGFEPRGGSSRGGHDKFVKGSIEVSVPRHRELKDNLAKSVLKKAGVQ